MSPPPPPAAGDPDADWVEAVVSAASPAELTTVGSRFAVVHEGRSVRRHEGLAPGTDHEIDGFAFTTLPEPGELLTTFATVNDVHFGEVECGVIDGSDIGPTFRTAPGDEPYPEVMNRRAVAEISACAPDAVGVKGDLTETRTEGEYDPIRGLDGPAF